MWFRNELSSLAEVSLYRIIFVMSVSLSAWNNLAVFTQPVGEDKNLVTIRQILRAVSMKICKNLYVAELIWVEITFKEKVQRNWSFFSLWIYFSFYEIVLFAKLLKWRKNECPGSNYICTALLCCVVLL